MNKLNLNEEEVAWNVSKIIGEDYLGNDDEIICKIKTTDKLDDMVNGGLETSLLL